MEVPEHRRWMDKRKEDGGLTTEFMNGVSEFIEFEIVQRRRMEALENGEGTSSSQNSVALLSENAIYLEVVGGRNKKGNVFGLGGLGDQYIKETYGTPFDAQLPTLHYV
ncbi:hypothetical protein RIF29_14621 [Crotalaria pallida]|uniref:Uncharacterized protein n=1 Tax=Crotalaria pallida TaxID=3830 RepID=A0AAN9IDX4_CROPI